MERFRSADLPFVKFINYPQNAVHLNAIAARERAEMAISGAGLLPAGQVEDPHPSEVVGSMTVLTSEMRLAGKPPWQACSRIISALGAM